MRDRDDVAAVKDESVSVAVGGSSENTRKVACSPLLYVGVALGLVLSLPLWGGIVYALTRLF